MSLLVTRRFALLGIGASAAGALSGCNTTPTPAVGASAGAANVAVDTSPLIAQSGAPTAQWVQDSLPGALSSVLASQLASGAGVLSVTINSVYLGQGGPGNPDAMTGVATLGGHSVNVRAISVYTPSPADTALVEQTNHYRVVALSQAFAYRLRKKWRQ